MLSFLSIGIIKNYRVDIKRHMVSIYIWHLSTERAETTQKELERITHDTSITSSQRSDRSCSVVSAASDISLGSDEVFLSTSAESREKERKGINKDWEVCDNTYSVRLYTFMQYLD